MRSEINASYNCYRCVTVLDGQAIAMAECKPALRENQRVVGRRFLAEHAVTVARGTRALGSDNLFFP